MESINFEKVLRCGLEALLLFLNALLLLIPTFLTGLLGGHIDAGTYIVAPLSFFLCALGGLIDLCKEEALPHWYVSPHKVLLYKLAVAFLAVGVILSFGMCLFVGVVSVTEENAKIFSMLFMVAFVLDFPYLGLRMSITAGLISLAQNKVHGVYPQIVDYIGPMLRRLKA